MKTSCHTLFLAALLFALPAEADAPDLELTVYNDNLALIKQCSEINLERGVQEYSFSGVPAKLLPSTVHFLSLSDPDGTHILEQNYRYDLLSREKLLERYRGREVKMEVDGMWRSVRLLQAGSPATGTAPPGRIVEIDGEIHIEGFILPALPEGLLLEPTLVWLLEAARRGKQRVELSYLTGGLSWQADYIAVVGQGDKLDLKG